MRVEQSREFLWLASQVKPFLRLYFGSYSCVVLASALVLLEPLIVKVLIDEVIPNRRLSWLPLVAAAFFLTYMGRLGFEGTAGMLNFRAVQKMTFRLRLRLLRHLQRLSAEYHDNKQVGDTLYRLQSDVDQIGTLSAEVLPTALRMVTMSTLVLGTMCVLNYRLTAIILPLIPVFILLRRSFHKRLREASDSAQEQSGRMIEFLEEHLSAIVQVQLLSCEQREARRFAHLSSNAVRAQMKRRITELLFGSILYLIIVLGMAAVLCYGGYEVMTGARNCRWPRRFLWVHAATLHSTLRSYRYLLKVAACRCERAAPDGDNGSGLGVARSTWSTDSPSQYLRNSRTSRSVV